MKILVTNDDGIQSKGLQVLVNWAKKYGEVVVSAPTVQQSAKSHAINIHEPIKVTQVPYLDGVTAYSVDSTPVDCVRFATLGLGQSYDLVLSGINYGLNMGEDILYSGTCGAIFEASLRGNKAIAFSTMPSDFAVAERYLDEAYQFIVKNKLFDYNDIYNVNIPLEVKGILLTKQGNAYFSDKFVKVSDTHFSQEGFCVHCNGNDMTIDTDATVSGYVTITPLTTRRDNATAYQQLKRLND